MKCPLMNKCGGCFFKDDDYQKQLQYKTEYVKKEVVKKGLPVKVHAANASPLQTGYRNKAIVAFNTKYEYGLYEENTKQIIPYQRCLLHENIMDDIFMFLQDYLKKYRFSIYDPYKNKGLLRHVLIRRAVVTDETMVVFICNDRILKGSKKLCQELVKKFPSIKTIVLNINMRKTPIVLGNENKILYGKGFIVDELCNLKFKISPQSFYQINHDQCVQLYTKALSLLKLNGSEKCIDAYCGIGTIGMILAQQASYVIGVENNRQAVGDAISNARINRLNNIQFVCDDASHFMNELAKEKEKIDIVIMDPPRSGSTEIFMNAIQRLKPKQVVYISCDPITQIRDLLYFKKIGYLTKDMYLYDMFPQTKHIESICLLSGNERQRNLKSSSKISGIKNLDTVWLKK